MLEPPTRGVGHLLSGSKFNKLLSSTLHWGATTMTTIKSKNTAKILHKIFRGSNGSNICPFICKHVKDWSHKFEIWHADQSAHALRKKYKTTFLWGQPVFQIFPKARSSKKYLRQILKGPSSTGPNILFTSCQEPAGIGTESIVNLIMPRKGFISYPNIDKK